MIQAVRKLEVSTQSLKPTGLVGGTLRIVQADDIEMAYVGNTERLCQAIVDHNLEEVREWLSQESSDPNIRDHAGRTPLQLACMTSTPEIVQCLVDHGARMIARIADGRTALHIAAARGDTESVRILLTKSEQNEEEESRKGGPKKASESEGQSEEKAASDQDDQSDVIMVDDDASRATSFVKVDRDAEEITDGASDEDPDIYDINVVSWDNHTSPLHLAILNGHVDVVEMLVGSFGADALLPIKLLQEYDNTPRAAILTLALALRLSPGKAKAMTEELLQLGASPAQADLKGCTPLHYLAASGYSELVDVYLQQDQAGVKRAINHLAFPGSSWGMKGYSAFTTAVAAGDAICALKLLDAGAAPAIGFDAFIKSAQMKYSRLKRNSSEENHRTFGENTWQPIIAAVEKDMPLLALDLLARGTDPNTLSREGFEARDSEYSRRRTVGTSLLDCVRAKLAKLRSYNGEPSDSEPPNPLDPDDNTYLKGIEEGTYKMWTGRHILKQERSQVAESQKTHETRMREAKDREGLAEKMAAVKGLVSGYERLECALLEKRAKTFKRLFPDIEGPYQPETDRAAVERSRAAPFEVSFTFKVPDLTEVKRDGYMRL